MIRQELYPDYHEKLIYDGNTSIEIIRKKGGRTILQDWLNFDSVEDAEDYFFNDCYGYQQFEN